LSNVNKCYKQSCLKVLNSNVIFFIYLRGVEIKYMKVKFKIKNEKDRLREFIVEFKNIEHLNNYRNTLIKTNCFIFKETYL